MAVIFLKRLDDVREKIGVYMKSINDHQCKKHTSTSTAINNNDLIVIAGFGDQINQLVNSLTDIMCLENIDILSSKVDNLITTLNNTKTQSTSYAKVTSQAIHPYGNIQQQMFKINTY
ncbi:hypothetical protein RDWZM_001354 [Blomia tropicalis]|uniref:Uncharacterized protein n=1 Tax=Blomia tropicalis TaxID=40697 RepID=A0A9Q0MBU0_BLOTA|nr:hypothetical protein RDWZM_001354 [Blomia tropicalis]